MPGARGVGREAEDRAAAYLLERGFTIVTRRFKAAHGEIDLVALDGETLVFVEVKARRAPGYAPEESLGEKKAERLARAASEYRAKTGEMERAVRYDAVFIDPTGIRHVPDAFHPEGR